MAVFTRKPKRTFSRYARPRHRNVRPTFRPPRRRWRATRRTFVVLAVFLAILFGLVFLVVSCHNNDDNKAPADSGTSADTAASAETSESGGDSGDGSGGDSGDGSGGDSDSDSNHIRILMSGDLVIHTAILDAAQTNEGNGINDVDNEYDFTPIFRYVKPYIEQADLAFCVLESPLVERDYTGYPSFRSPDKLAADLSTVGYDLVSMSSNHVNDAGGDAILRTISVLRDAGLTNVGTRNDTNETRYTMQEIRGTRVAIISYTYADGYREGRIMNDSYLAGNMHPLVNTFGYDTIDQDLEDVRNDCLAARMAGADVVIVYYHWGTEYETHSNELQQDIAERTAAMTDVDMIVGSHPHAPQEKATVKNSEGEDSPVYYAMGNLISNQRREYMDGNRIPEEGYMLSVDINLSEDGSVSSITEKPIPYWMDASGQGTETYTIVPLVGPYWWNKTIVATGHVAESKQAAEDIAAILAGTFTEAVDGN